MVRFVVWWVVFFPVVCAAQFNYTLDQSIPVQDNFAKPLSLPWAGGLNATQYNTYDFNGDQKEDLVLFDRMGNTVKTFSNEGDHYAYRPEYELIFPPLTNWLIMRDFNCDGKKDIFTGDALGIRVFKNISIAGEIPKWEPFFFFSQAGASKSTVVLTKGFSGKINLQLQYDDLPSFVDVDGDGDLDILNFRYVGEGSVEFHKNYSKERYNSCDSLDFERVTQNWGNFIECECGVVAFNGDPCSPHGGGRIQHAGGKSIFAIDLDNDQDQDILYSEAGCNNLFLLMNEGDSENPIFNTDQLFPVQYNANLWTFPVPFYEDVDFDGVKDLMVTPNVFKREFPEVNLNHSNWLYKNIGTDLQPDLIYKQNDFLQQNMIDVGDNATPVLFDLDGDSDLDLLIGQYIETKNQNASLYHYENIGTVTQPSFKLITTDYLSISNEGFINIKPQFTDVNADGKPDLVITATSLATVQTKLYTLLNKASSGVDFSGQSFNPVTFNMLFSENVHLTDISGDGIPDLLIGKSNGTIEYWKNNGPSGTLNFNLAEADFLDLGPSIERQSPSITTADLNADGKTELIFGDQSGLLHIINNFKNTQQEPFIINEIIFDSIANEYIPKKLGGRSWPTIGNLFNTNYPAIVVGNTLGGIHLLKNDEGQSLPDEVVDIEIYPVPVRRPDVLNIKSNRYTSVQIISTLGQALTSPFFIIANQTFQLNLPTLSAGVYLLQLKTGNKTQVRRIVVY